MLKHCCLKPTRRINLWLFWFHIFLRRMYFYSYKGSRHLDMLKILIYSIPLKVGRFLLSSRYASSIFASKCAIILNLSNVRLIKLSSNAVFLNLNKFCRLVSNLNKKNSARCEICLKLTIKTPEQWLVSLLLVLKILHTLF